MKVAVTGAGGQLGRSIFAHGGAERGIELVAIGRPAADLERIGSVAEAIEAVRPDVVINAAAYTAVDRAEAEPSRAMRINAEAAGEVAGAARRVGASVIQISTDYVFDGRTDRPMVEDDACAPLNVYGASKLQGEMRVREGNPAHLILRTSWLYGRYGRNFARTMMAKAAAGERVRVVRDQVGSPSWAREVAGGIHRILERWTHDRTAGLGQTFHLAGSRSASWFELAERIFATGRALGLPSVDVEPVDTETRPGQAVRPRRSDLDCAKFEAVFGYSPQPWRVSVDAFMAELAGESASSSAAR